MDAPFTDQQLITLYKKGMKDREIAAELGVKRNAVKHRRRKLDLLRTRLFTDQQLIDLHRDHQDAIRDALRRLFQHHGMKSL